MHFTSFFTRFACKRTERKKKQPATTKKHIQPGLEYRSMHFSFRTLNWLKEFNDVVCFISSEIEVCVQTMMYTREQNEEKNKQNMKK